MKSVPVVGVLTLIVGCSALGPSSPITLRLADTGLLRLSATRYRVDWKAAGCSFLRIEWAPTSAGQVPTDIPASPPSGSFTTALTGDGYLNRTADCDLVVTLTPE